MRSAPSLLCRSADPRANLLSRVPFADRINQHSLPLDNEYSPTFEGVGIHVFVLDTGVMPSHAEFEDRLGVGANCIGGGGCKVDEPTTDRQGHGTHVACTVGSDDFGVADRVTIHPVKVLNDNGSGSVMNVVNGMRWVATLVENNKGSLRGKSVVVMSLGTQRDEFLNEAADALVDSGVPVVVAAGNNSEDACDFSPASATKVISVGATDSHDRLPDFTNFGSCVTILAPGTAINSCDIAHMTASVTKSGTSMAAPHVAGVVAQLLERAALKDEMLTPEQVKEQLLDMATHGAANIGSNQRGTASIMLAVPGTVPVDTSAGMATVLLIVAICCGVCTLVVRKTGQEQRWGVQGMFDMA